MFQFFREGGCGLAATIRTARPPPTQGKGSRESNHLVTLEPAGPARTPRRLLRRRLRYLSRGRGIPGILDRLPDGLGRGTVRQPIVGNRYEPDERPCLRRRPGKRADRRVHRLEAVRQVLGLGSARWESRTGGLHLSDR